MSLLSTNGNFYMTLGQITPFSWASVVSCIKLEFQYPFYPLGGIVENIRVTEEKWPHIL